MSEMPFESPVEDLAEQQSAVVPDDNEESSHGTPEWTQVAWDANPADAQEQGVEVPFDEDEWR